MTTQLTPEQQAQIYQENERQRIVSFDFMTRHISDYVRNQHNGRLIADYLKETGREWTIDNLEEAFTFLSDQGLFDPTPGPEEVVPPAPAQVADLPPWGTTLTKVWLRSATKEQLRSILKSKWGTAFEEAVRQLKSQRSV